MRRKPHWDWDGWFPAPASRPRRGPVLLVIILLALASLLLAIAAFW